MSLFEFVAGMISVLMALSVAQLLIGLGRLVQETSRVRTYYPHTIWVLLIFLVTFLHWWSLWDFRHLDWNWAMFFYSLLGPTFLFFAATLICPIPRESKPVDLQEHFENIRIVFLTVLLLAVVLMSLDGPLFGIEPAFNLLRFIQLLVALCVAGCLISKKPGIQSRLATVAFAILSCGSILRFFPGKLI